MINGLGVVGWGVGGIEAEACMLGQPISMLLPAVVGFKLHGKLPAGCTATDLVLTVTQMLRKKGVVGKFVEFYGAGLECAERGGPRDDREHGAGIWRDDRILSRWTTERWIICGLPTAIRNWWNWWKLIRRSRRCSARMRRRIRCFPHRSNWIWELWCRRWRVRSVRRIV